MLHGQHYLGEFQRHREECNNNHPECRTGPADPNRNGNPGDVAEANRAGERGAQGLKLADLTRCIGVCIVSLENAYGHWEAADIHKAEVDGKE